MSKTMTEVLAEHFLHSIEATWVQPIHTWLVVCNCEAIPMPAASYVEAEEKFTAHQSAALTAAGFGLVADAKGEALEEAAGEFAARLPDGTGNGRAYNSHQVAHMLRARAAAVRGEG
jgi:hypothetical protein